MDNIISALLEQRKRLVQESCEINYNETTSNNKYINLERQIEKIDEQIIKLLTLPK